VSRLRHILDNVFDNALKFTPSNGQIKIDVQYMGQDVNQLFIHISDTGPGIPEAARQRIFEPFFQVDPILSRHHEGPGLGLTIVRNLLELHGGKIEAFNHEGGGAVFNITLPAKA
jgi:signal transduction histidine kinase